MCMQPMSMRVICFSFKAFQSYQGSPICQKNHISMATFNSIHSLCYSMSFLLLLQILCKEYSF
jgi:hypothetical protein